MIKLWIVCFTSVQMKLFFRSIIPIAFSTNSLHPISWTIYRSSLTTLPATDDNSENNNIYLCCAGSLFFFCTKWEKQVAHARKFKNCCLLQWQIVSNEMNEREKNPFVKLASTAFYFIWFFFFVAFILLHEAIPFHLVLAVFICSSVGFCFCRTFSLILCLSTLNI